MLKKFKNSEKNKFFLIIALLVFIPLGIYATGLVQDIRNRAAGTNEVGLRFSPMSGIYKPGDVIDLKVTLHKLVSRSINVSGAQAVFTVSDKFNVGEVNCQSPFDGLPFVKVNGQTVTVFCAINTFTSPVPVTSSDLPFASVSLTVSQQALEGQALIEFVSTRVTESGISGQAPDVSTAGTSATFTIVIPPTCPRGDMGNLDCDNFGCIDTADFELFRQAYGKTVGEITVPTGQHTPDLVTDSFNMIDTADYEILRSNFGTCSN
ncbi:hypothetical protein A3D05_01555 [Candidatus Gottesmanbacteria bacterium RIFCSPHIGHO2_02_FULL_40_24]|uniref:Cohesin domain-containing protein n=1 Tax=Candidatus Gottesmanbacteria bacterium RIFCSPHIGHO2_01_FULL_40_15 TaxID=1798376 RepID=A0A1F5YZD0_9BACT|nr:MAG: hypothetical protein A2777_04460 [Candidatus Gottesmanbacteria bacterium RIFCSPHIGHO2_01_FULL_40_15]OGG16352.1 MAG: hypothetical protein A3D05_01555 [Candidatus Gottesmanbacteria bacterium RIFCSPHIGHO2_02_FULL_40_24]OGG21288.1 MAG: hypothetical protein A3B48_04645 [Candidatus Gottesmanbacteria bacterium RIFCSPLOWO2_01_FULL_40_10]OGG23448.1 MAG: hypothetical protein A3E42_00175 [Candidatus Gottesmanbacteria bacterium RIFCSPHIGHO2_12_FULL_40_13]OGG33046.1 MAG: hypothetical protein A3I80_0